MGPYGATVLAPGIGEVAADIVFVHGLRGDSVETWSKDGIYWPKSFLPKDVPNARIIAWGYDSSVVRAIGPSSEASIFGHAENLLTDLCALRFSRTIESRPIIFVGHSLGGLVIKEALIRSSEYLNSYQDAKLAAIYSNTKGVVFIGTPHRGSDKTVLAEIVANVVKIGLKRPNGKLLKTIATESQLLERQGKSFASISYGMPIACVSEELGTGIGVIVPKSSATLDGFWVKECSIPANHMDMCRFTSVTDVGYQRLSYYIKKFVEGAGKSMDIGQYSLVEDLLHSLEFPEMHTREEQIDEVYARTCQWLLPSKDPSLKNQFSDGFEQWLKDPKTRLYWIRGKAGSGKSTLMKYLFEILELRSYMASWASPRPIVYLGFFFFDRGKSVLQKSREGLLRSLIHQILTQRNNLGPDIYALRVKLLQKATKPGEKIRPKNWSWQELKFVFESLLAQNSEALKFCIFVDGLDEYNMGESPGSSYEDEEDMVSEKIKRKEAGHNEIANLFLGVARAPNVKLCVSSRPLLRFDKAFGTHLHLKLEELTAPDIAIYVEGRLGHDPDMLDLMQEDREGSKAIMGEIVRKAEGVFLWVKLVVDLLIEDLSDQSTISELRNTVNSLPRQLGGRNGLYMRMLEDIKPAFLPQAAKLFRITQSARAPISSLCLAFAEDADLQSIKDTKIEQISSSKAQIQSKRMTGRLKSRCAGILETHPVPSGRQSDFDGIPDPMEMVQFLHQTAKEFMEQDFIWDTIFEQKTLIDFDPNLSLIQICILKLKSFGYYGPSAFRAKEHIWNIIMDAMFYASRIHESSKGAEVMVALLDELNNVAKIILRFGSDKLTSVPDMWAVTSQNLEPVWSEQNWLDTAPNSDPNYPCYQTQHPFLVFAIQNNVHAYVKAKLEMGNICLSGEKGRPLLAAAVVPAGPSSKSPWRLQAERSMVQLLLDYGADPNEVYMDSIPPAMASIWQKALMRSDDEGCRSFGVVHQTPEHNVPDQTRWIDNMELLIQRHADPNIPGTTSHPTTGFDYSPLFIIGTALKYRHVERNRLQALLKKNGARYLPGEIAKLRKNGVRLPAEDQPDPVEDKPDH